MAGEHLPPYIKNENYDDSFKGVIRRAFFPWTTKEELDTQYVPNPAYPHNAGYIPQSTFKAGVTDAAEIAAEKAEREARDTVSKEVNTDGSVLGGTNLTAPATTSPPYIKNENYDDSFKGVIRRAFFPWLTSKDVDYQYVENPAYPHNAGYIPQSTFKAGVTDAAELAAQKAEREARDTVSKAVNTVGSVLGGINLTAPATTSPPSTSSTTVAKQSATKPTATTPTQGTRTATPTTTQTARVAPITGGGVYQGGLPPKQPQPTAMTGGGVYQGGLPPKQPIAPQPVPQQVVGYVPPPVRDGYDMVGSAKQAFVPGTPISENVARAMYKLQNETNTARNQMMSSARTGQVMDAMNNPDTYRVAEMFARQGMPMDQAMHLAMTQTTAAKGDWLGTGATIPAGQKALSDMNDRNMQFSFMLDTPWEAREVNGPVYMANPYFRAMKPNGTIVTSNGVVTGLNGDQMMTLAAAGNNPWVVNQSLWTANLTNQTRVADALNKISYGSNKGGTNKQVSDEADKIIADAEKNKGATTPTVTSTLYGQ